ncbi:hypothetical protein GCM10017044_09420 [Kordiimonas sediminis]|uniref:DUF934 domain-containing protein n=1 Tax=Kordiimonas sediminis TaxID=1735581 RepID=A0A919E3W8_9PROT|nr:DUF934 domain-containing protein [Kordiimonas sediminis]GHF17168.1 hypothetical protein GCM10017044_09420 [Kordiimonas sediminis]
MKRINLTGRALSDVALTVFDQSPEAAQELAGKNAPYGLILTTETAYSDLDPELIEKADLIAIDFPAFGDGRGFSLAVRLRKDFNFTGELRATGPVIPDQAQFLLRAGFDSVDTDDARAAAFQKAAGRFTAFYQTDYTGNTSVAHTRHGPSQRERKAS